MFIVDCTKSMGVWITQIKDNLQSIIQEIKKTTPNNQLRIAIVGFRDVFDPQTNFEILDFTDNMMTVDSFLLNLKDFGGIDLCEDSIGGIYKA